MRFNFINKKVFQHTLFALLFIITHVLIASNGIKSVNTDKSRYNPSSEIHFIAELNENAENLKLKVSYYSLDKIVETTELDINGSQIKWVWNPPSIDFKGYLAKLALEQNGEIIDETTIGVDVSSDWNKFPRYGFLSKYPSIHPDTIGNNIARLNRYHINGLQFYDWLYKHHDPLKGTPDAPSMTWNDIAGNLVYFWTVRRYIDSAHVRNMKAMAYNLLYGAFEDATVDGVPNEWRLFSDTHHSNPDIHDLPSDWESDIYLMDPTNTEWQDHIVGEMKGVFDTLKFDGWHIDQLGDRGNRYNYNGIYVNMPRGIKEILVKAKDSINCNLVTNAVNQYAQKEISESPMDFLYTEVWEPNITYDKLGSIILYNDNLTNNELRTTIAAYIHKEISNSAGVFNAPAVLLADAVIFAFGGTHLELGEHMLSNEYFPNDNMKVSTELRTELTSYYDFLVGYQNLLRDGGDVIDEQLQTTGDLPFSKWSRSYTVWNFARELNNKKIFHLINFSDATTLDWRDNLQTQSVPNEQNNIPIYYETGETVYKIWFASPDYKKGEPIEIEFEQIDGKVSFILPYLKYWDMVVLDFDETSTAVEKENNEQNIQSFSLEQNFPNPFNPTTMIKYGLPEQSNIKIELFNMLGQSVGVLVNDEKSAGFYKTAWNAKNLPSGIYLISIRAEGLASKKNFTQVKKALFLK